MCNISKTYLYLTEILLETDEYIDFFNSWDIELLDVHFLGAQPDAFLVHVHQIYPIFSTFFFFPLICFLFSPAIHL